MDFPSIGSTGKTTHAECPRKWRLTDRTWGMGYNPIYPIPALRIGKAFHRWAQMYYQGNQLDWETLVDLVLFEQWAGIRGNNPLGLTDDQTEELMKQDRLVRGMAHGYHLWMRSHRLGNLDNSFYNVIGTEVPFNLK